PWDQALTEIQAWQSMKPSSEAARFVESQYWEHYAWFARGQGYSNTVGKEGWRLFDDRMNRAKSILAHLIQTDSQCPIVYAAMIDDMSVTGSDEAELRKVYTYASARFPTNQSIYFAMATNYQPRWGGSPAKFDAFADEAAKQTAAFEGAGMYARLYWI